MFCFRNYHFSEISGSVGGKWLYPEITSPVFTQTLSAVADDRGSKRLTLQEANPVSISRLAARSFAILLLLCFGQLIEANLTFAQSSNANLSGTVTDSSGAVV